MIVVGDLVTDVLVAHDEPIAFGSDTAASITVSGGGQAANTAAWLARAGRAVTLVAAVGDDLAGRERVAELAAAGVRCAIRAHPGAATGSVVVLTGRGERTLITDRGAGSLLDPDDVVAAIAAAANPATDSITGSTADPITDPAAGSADGPITGPVTGSAADPITDPAAGSAAGSADGPITGLVAGSAALPFGRLGAGVGLVSDGGLGGPLGARHLHLSGYTLLHDGPRPAGLAALAAAAGHGLTTSVDAASAEPLRSVGAPAFLAWVRGTDLLLANEDEAEVLAGPGPADQQARRLTAHVRNVVVKRGAAGAVWAARDGLDLSVAAVSVRLQDPTGAGDAFAAGLLAAWCFGAGPQAALVAGAALGAEAVTRIGARPRS